MINVFVKNLTNQKQKIYNIIYFSALVIIVLERNIASYLKILKIQQYVWQYFNQGIIIEKGEILRELMIQKTQFNKKNLLIITEVYQSQDKTLINWEDNQ